VSFILFLSPSFLALSRPAIPQPLPHIAPNPSPRGAPPFPPKSHSKQIKSLTGTTPNELARALGPTNSVTTQRPYFQQIAWIAIKEISEKAGQQTRLITPQLSELREIPMVKTCHSLQSLLTQNVEAFQPDPHCKAFRINNLITTLTGLTAYTSLEAKACGANLLARNVTYFCPACT